MRRNRHTMGNLVDYVQFLDGDLIDLVEQIDAGYVDAVALDDVDEVVAGGVVPQRDVRIVYLVLGQNGLDQIRVQLGLRHHAVEVDAALVLPLVVDVRGFLVQPDAEALQLVLQQLLVTQWLQAIQHHKNEVTGSRHCYHLPTTTLAILGTLNDSGQIQQLDLGALVFNAAGHRRERGELVSRHLGVNASQIGE